MSTSPTPEHLSGRGMDGGATASTDATAIQDIVRRKMAAAELARQRGQMSEEELRLEEEAEKAREKIGTRKDGSFGLLNDERYEDGEDREVRNEEEIVKPLDRVEIKPILKNANKAEVEEEEENKDEPQLKRRVSKMWKSAIVKIRGPAVARGL